MAGELKLQECNDACLAEGADLCALDVWTAVLSERSGQCWWYTGAAACREGADDPMFLSGDYLRWALCAPGASPSCWPPDG